MPSPAAVPTSFEGPFGKIIYRIRAAIDTPRFSKDYKAQKPFYLLNLLNLNNVPDIEVRSRCVFFSAELVEATETEGREDTREQSARLLDDAPTQTQSLSPQQTSYAVTTKKFNYLLVKTGTLMLKARSDLRGYIPGQIIKLATEIHNKSGKDTGCVLASLIQVDD